jgi:hypothetical protein
MRNSQPPPRYGAEGPPGGAEAWNRQRSPQPQQQGGAALGQMVRAMVDKTGVRHGMGMQQQPRPTAPDWSQGQRMQWGQQPAPGPSAPPANGMAMMPGPSAPPAQPPQQPPAQGAAGLGQAARGMYDRARVNALRGRGQVQQ